MTITSFFAGMDNIRHILSSTESLESRFTELQPLLDDPDLRRDFFRELDNPDWLTILRDNDFFKHPPSPVKTEQGHRYFPQWPETGYVARMASHLPDEVTNIFLSLETDNWAVAKDLFKAAKELPSAFTAELIPKIVEIVHKNVLRFALDDVAELCEKLAEDGCLDESVDLMKAAFSLSWKEHVHQNSREHYWYLEGLKERLIPALLPSRSEQLLSHFISELSNAIDVYEYSDESSGDDHSYLWRPAVEEHEQNRKYDIKSNLVGCLRKAIETSVTEEYLELQNVLTLLDDQGFLIFKRMKIHLVRVFAGQVPELVKKYLTDRELFDDDILKHEYALLASDRFELLSSEEKNEWYGWVESGPYAFDEDCYRNYESEEDRNSYRDWWKFNKLLWVRKHLEGERLQFVEKMRDEEGDPKLAFFNVYSDSGFRGDESPYSVSDLEKKTFKEAVEAVCSWEEPSDASRFDGPTYDGLRSDFERYCSTNPEKFSEDAELLRSKPLGYVRSFLQAMKQGVENEKKIEISPVLKLCDWVVQTLAEEMTSPVHNEPEHHDSDWQWTWDTVAGLMQAICKQNVSVIEYRDRVWSVIQPLLKAPGGSNLSKDLDNSDLRAEDFANYSLNSSQGKAMFAVMAYARWVANAVVMQKDGKDVVEGGYVHMPEVKEVLEEKLQPGDPGGFAARAVYGWNFGLLNWIDREWLKSRADDIFNLWQIEKDPKTAYGWAAWNTFLTGTQPHNAFYEILKDQFSYAVDQAAQIEINQNDYERPYDSLGEHLIVLYGQGHLDLSVDDEILKRFLARAKQSIRTHAMEFVGISLGNEKEELSGDISQRFTTLWEWYWNEVGREDARSTPNSAVFGYWFSSGVFDEKWSLEQLEKFVKVVPKPEPDTDIVKRLAEIASVDLPRSVTILKRMIDGDDDYWRVSSWHNEAKEILRQALASNDETKRLAEQVIDRLGRRGFLEFGELLEI